MSLGINTTSSRAPLKEKPRPKLFTGSHIYKIVIQGICQITRSNHREQISQLLL